jgi:hypothetical protein
MILCAHDAFQEKHPEVCSVRKGQFACSRNFVDLQPFWLNCRNWKLADGDPSHKVQSEGAGSLGCLLRNFHLNRDLTAILENVQTAAHSD